jgi:hypothetical protein
VIRLQDRFRKRRNPANIFGFCQQSRP